MLESPHSDMSAVSDALMQSRAKHAEYQQANVAQDPASEKAAIEAAQYLRQQAHDADPAHADLEWKHDRVPHEMYMNFYEDYLEAHP